MSDQHEVPAQFSAALARLDGDVTLLREMATITIEDLPSVQNDLEDAVNKDDAERAANGFHRLKGMLSTFESEGVTIDIQEMLDLTRQGNLDEARALYARSKPAITQLVGQVSAFVNGST